MPTYQYGPNNMLIRKNDDGSATWMGMTDQNFEWAQLKDRVEQGKIVVAEADPIPEPTPSAAEQLDVLVEQAHASLAKASTNDEIKAVVSGVLGGMKSIFGTSR